MLITALQQLAHTCVGVPNLKFTVKYACMPNPLVYNDAEMLTASLLALIRARSNNQINVVADNGDSVPVVDFLGIPEESLLFKMYYYSFNWTVSHTNNQNNNDINSNIIIIT